MQEPEQGTEQPIQDSATESAAHQSMGALLEEHEAERRSLRRGEVVEGTIVRVDRDEVLVDIGAKSEAVIPFHEIRSHELAMLNVGTPVVAYVLQSEDHEGRAVLSLTRAEQERNWRALAGNHEAGDVLSGRVVEANKGGLIVSVLGIRGFVPLSQISDLRRGEGGEAAIEESLRARVGKDAHVKVIEINRRRNRLILSERAAAQQRRAEQKDRLLDELQPGQVRQGFVSSIADFGAFVDLGGADGLVHLSELSWRQVGHPREVVSVGQSVDAQVLSVDREKKKIALSIKRLQAEPWSVVSEKFNTGDLVGGKVTKLAPFGAFVEIEDGIEGLIHISELSHERITHPKQVVREGDRVQVRVLRIDPPRRRLGLSLRQGGYVLEPAAEAEQEADEGRTNAAETAAANQPPTERAPEQSPTAEHTPVANESAPEGANEPVGGTRPQSEGIDETAPRAAAEEIEPQASADAAHQPSEAVTDSPPEKAPAGADEPAGVADASDAVEQSKDEIGAPQPDEGVPANVEDQPFESNHVAERPEPAAEVVRNT